MFTFFIVKKISFSAITESDQSGKHAPCNKLDDDIIKQVKDHISSFPSYEATILEKEQKKILVA